MAEYIFTLKQRTKSKVTAKAENIKKAKDKVIKKCFDNSFNGLKQSDFTIELDRIKPKNKPICKP